jgi:hypothetical protein
MQDLSEFEKKELMSRITKLAIRLTEREAEWLEAYNSCIKEICKRCGGLEEKEPDRCKKACITISVIHYAFWDVIKEVKVADGTPTTNDGIPPNNKLSGILPTIL